MSEAPDDRGHVQRRRVERRDAGDGRRGQEQRELGAAKNDAVDAFFIS